MIGLGAWGEMLGSFGMYVMRGNRREDSRYMDGSRSQRKNTALDASEGDAQVMEESIPYVGRTLFSICVGDSGTAKGN